jgi:hypothetical protein
MLTLRDGGLVLQGAQPCPERPPHVHFRVVTLKHSGSQAFFRPEAADVLKRSLRRALERLCSEDGLDERLLEPLLDHLLNDIVRAPERRSSGRSSVRSCP